MSKTPDTDTLFAKVEVPGPPDALRARALDAAVEAAAAPRGVGQRVRVERRWVERLWLAWPARVAWAVAIGGLVVANIHMARSPLVDRGGPHRTADLATDDDALLVGLEAALPPVARSTRAELLAILQVELEGGTPRS